MKKNNKIYLVLALVIGILSLLAIMIFTDSHYDKNLTSQIHRYKDARKEILRELPFLIEKNHTGSKLCDGLKIKFEISKEFAGLNGLDTLENLYVDKLIDDLFITEKGEIVFKLKESNYLEGQEQDERVHYSHMFSKNRVNFEEYETQVKVEERNTIEEWSYVIVSIMH